MKQNKKGFTLIELLAVIVILAIIALIAVPVIMNILDKANKSAFKDTAYGIISAGELYFAEQQLELNGMSGDKTFNLSDENNGLQLKGDVPDNGTLVVNEKGQTALATSNGRYCITKGFDDTDVSLSEDVEHCYVPQTLAALSLEEVECATDKTEGACGLGTLFTLRVNDNETKDFYVMKDYGDKVTLIMSENLGDEVEWSLDACGLVEEDWDGDGVIDDSWEGCYTTEGPTTAINELDVLTDEEWNNIPNRDYLYSGIAEDGKTRVYEDITRNMRARMATYDEIDTIIVANDNTAPDWLYGNLYTSTNTSLPYGYWTSTALASNSYIAWNVTTIGNLNYDNVNLDDNDGLRPVIELSK